LLKPLAAIMLEIARSAVLTLRLHVDGGTFMQAFLYPSAATSARRAAIARGRRIQPARAWIIRNGLGTPPPDAMPAPPASETFGTGAGTRANPHAGHGRIVRCPPGFW
jgi:hypothetical protein